MWHFQVTDNWKLRWDYNNIHQGLKHGWFAIYDFRPFKKVVTGINKEGS
ncbi:MAG: hypothetical protein ACOC22_02640 [bacterium]